jgi:small subunit ribosomal protein S17
MARRMRGTVSSNKMDKTVVITVQRVKTHPIYRKKYNETTKFKAHDEANACNIGDIVEVVEGRPLSRDKRWTVERVIAAAEVDV